MTRPVFISYSERDRECALELVAYAESAGHPCWVAPRDISPSAEWAAEIIDAISAARIMVLLFSSASNDSPQVRREVERAVHKNVPILPFRIENVLPSKSLEYFLSAQHWLDGFPPPRAPHYESLCRHLRRALGETTSGGATPEHGPVAGGSPIVLPSGRIDPAVTERVERELAGHVGPVARVLVARAVRRVAGVDELASTLAAEIDDVPARRRFLEFCRSLSGGGLG